MSEELNSTKTDFDFTKVKVKQEKVSPPLKKEKDADEILSGILPLTNLFGNENSNGTDETEEKKPLEPVKSSNEILAELFKVFNAAPPESLLNDDYLLKKKKKHKSKDKKHRKKSKKRDRSSSDEDENDSDHKHKKKHKKKDKKHKKSKKRKHSESREGSYESVPEIKKEKVSPKQSDSELSLSDVEDLMVYPQPIVDTSIVKKEKLENGTTRTSGKIVIKSLKNSSIFKEAEKMVDKTERDRSKRNSESKGKDESSEISLSDEEEYLREKEMFYKSSDYYEREERYRSRRHTRSRYNTPKDRFRSKWRDRSRSRHRRRSRSRSRSQELMIDKKRLLEIARKNAITMFKSGSLPGTQGMSQEVKDKVVMKMRYGGKTVEELTEFCKKLSKGESLNDLSSLSSNEDSDYDKHGKEKVFYHPFVLKDRGPIVMNIKNATPIPPKTAEQTKAILMQYPVSSGQMHRMTENEWVPVSPKRSAPPPLPPPKPQAPKNVFEKPLPTEQQKPAFTPLPPNSEPMGMLPPNSVPIAPDASIIPVPPVPPTTVSLGTSLSLAPPAPPPPVPQSDCIFPQPTQNLDVSSIISQRLNAMRKLQENPNDPEALKMMYNSQREMSAWATSNFTPGQFTGSTGAKILSAQELTAGQQAWAKRILKKRRPG